MSSPGEDSSKKLAIKLAPEDAKERQSGGRADPGPGDLNAAPSSMPEPVELPDPPTGTVPASSASTAPISIEAVPDASGTEATGTAASGAEASDVEGGSGPESGAPDVSGADASGAGPSGAEASGAEASGAAASGAEASGADASGVEGSAAPASGAESGAEPSTPPSSAASATSPGPSITSPAASSAMASQMQASSSKQGSAAASSALSSKPGSQTSKPGSQTSKLGSQTSKPASKSGSRAKSKSAQSKTSVIKSSSSAAGKSKSGPSVGKSSSNLSATGSRPISQPKVSGKSGVSHSKHSEDGNSDLMKSMSPGGGKLETITTTGKDGKKVTKFRYHKRITVRTKGSTKPEAVLAKVNKKDHKAGITISTLDNLNSAEVMKRAGLKPNEKGQWRLRLRQTKKVTKNGKTHIETKVAYRDSQGNKKVETSTDPFCKKCGKHAKDCHCTKHSHHH